jgi:hypothetical protein
MTIAHIGGLPLEETVQMLAPAATATITMTIAWLRRR